MGTFLELLLSILKLFAKNEPTSAPAESAPTEPSTESHFGLVSENGLKLISHFEGLRLKPYLDSVQVPTIGFGTTYYEDGTKVTMNDPEITEERAYELLAFAAKKFSSGVHKLVIVSLTQNQFDALVSFTYNLGLGSLQKSTLLKLLNAGNYEAAADEFLKWNKAGGKVLDGLSARRKAERELFLA